MNVAAVMTLLVAPLVMRAQVRDLRPVVEVSLGVLRTGPNPFGDEGLASAGLGIHRVLSRGVSARLVVDYGTTIRNGDDVSICYFRPGGGCWSHPVAPRRMIAGGAMLLAEVPRIRVLSLVGGVGVVHGWKPNVWAGGVIVDPTRNSATAQLGAELALGPWRRALRVRYAHTWLSRPQWEGRAMDLVRLAWMP